LRKVLGLANVTAADPELIATALDWAERGVDFADDLHLAASRECSAFVTFDAAFISTVNGLSRCVVKKRGEMENYSNQCSALPAST
jgi:hypothetical protein